MPIDDAERALYDAYTALYYLLHEQVELVYIWRQQGIVAARKAALEAVCQGSKARIRWAKEMAYIEVFG